MEVAVPYVTLDEIIEYICRSCTGMILDAEISSHVYNNLVMNVHWNVTEWQQISDNCSVHSRFSDFSYSEIPESCMLQVQSLKCFC